VAIAREFRFDGLRAAGQQSRGMDVVAGHGLAHFLENRCGRLEVEGFAEAEALELVREDAQQVKVAARAHDFGGLMQQLDFAGGVGDAAVFFVSRSGGEDHVGKLRGLGHEHFVNDEEAELAASGAGF
jgi:hypothetical protein